MTIGKKMCSLYVRGYRQENEEVKIGYLGHSYTGCQCVFDKINFSSLTGMAFRVLG